MSGGYRMLLMPYGDRWRRIRKIMHQVLNTRQADKFKVYQDVQSRRVLRTYLRTPSKWYLANQTFANSVILSVVFGRESSVDDADMAELLAQSEAFLRNFKPGANIADAIPALAYLPPFMQWWRPKALALFERSKACYKKEVDKLKKKIDEGTAEPCFAVDWFKAHENEKDRPADWDVESYFVFGTLMEAGSDTSRVAIGQAVAAAAIYPEWVQKARAELDAVCGDAERLPSFEDRKDIPYLTAVVKETLRWRPFIQAGVNRVLIKDDEYKGYKFPKGTVFTWNPWGIALNPAEYDQPLDFIPDRFLNEDLDNPLKGHWSFGAGRRVCAGWNVGDTNVWIVVSRLIYCFDFSQVPGNPIDTMNTPWMKHDGPSFQVNIKPRSEKHAALIERECPGN
ncbi:cytochrome P450 [Cadophora sp. DSE1049]|nr:cytochrome P450 [Cadophora sp. DSE1049]